MAIYISEVRSHMAHQLYKLHARTPYEIVAGDTPDFMEWLEYDFYQPVWFYSPAVFPVEKQLLGRWLGVAHRVGQALCYWILPVSGVPIARLMEQRISKDDLTTKEVIDELASYDMSIAVFFAKKNHKYPSLDMEETQGLTTDIFNMECAKHAVDQYEPESSMPEAESYDKESLDKLLSVHVSLPRVEGVEHVKDIGSKCDQDGCPVGHSNANPLLNTRVYEVEFQDGYIQEYLANTIAENIWFIQR